MHHSHNETSFPILFKHIAFLFYFIPLYFWNQKGFQIIQARSEEWLLFSPLDISLGSRLLCTHVANMNKTNRISLQPVTLLEPHFPQPYDNEEREEKAHIMCWWLEGKYFAFCGMQYFGGKSNSYYNYCFVWLCFPWNHWIFYTCWLANRIFSIFSFSMINIVNVRNFYCFVQTLLQSRLSTFHYPLFGLLCSLSFWNKCGTL